MSIGGRSSGLSMIGGTPGSNSGKPPLKAIGLLSNKQSGVSLNGSLKSSSNYNKEMLRRHKKSLIIIHLLKMQGLGIHAISSLFLKELTFEKTREFKAIFGYFNKGHLELLRFYGEPETLIAELELDPQLAEQ